MNELDYNEYVFNEITFESNNALEYVSKILEKMKKWWKNQALPFIKNTVKSFTTWIVNSLKNIKKLPQKIWKKILVMTNKLKSNLKDASNEINRKNTFVTESVDTGYIDDEDFKILLEETLDAEFLGYDPTKKRKKTFNPKKFKPKTFEYDKFEYEKFEYDKFEYDKFDPERFKLMDDDTEGPVIDVDFNDLNNVAKNINGNIDEFINETKDAANNMSDSIESDFEKDEDNNKAAKKSNAWMAKVSKILKSIASFFKNIKDNILEILQKIKK